MQRPWRTSAMLLLLLLSSISATVFGSMPLYVCAECTEMITDHLATLFSRST
jgi:hypothetical protein